MSDRKVVDLVEGRDDTYGKTTEFISHVAAFYMTRAEKQLILSAAGLTNWQCRIY
jgi:hypothetical protein